MAETVFYVEVRKMVGRGAQGEIWKTGRLLGPYDTKAEADGNVDRTRRPAYEIDPSTHFAEFGVGQYEVPEGATAPKGRLNQAIGLRRATGLCNEEE